MKTFEQFLRDNSETGVDFHLRVTKHSDGLISFYIHPQGRDGETYDYYARGLSLDPKQAFDNLVNAIFKDKPKKQSL